MKKFMSALMAACMIFLVSCSSSAEKFYDEKYDYIEELTEAIAEKDNDEIKSVEEDIDQWIAGLKADAEKLNKEIKTGSDEVNSLCGDIWGAAIDREAKLSFNEALGAYYSTQNTLVYVDNDAGMELLGLFLENICEIWEFASDGNSHEVKRLAKAFKSQCEEKSKEYDGIKKEYNDKIKELKAKEGKDAVEAAEEIMEKALGELD